MENSSFLASHDSRVPSKALTIWILGAMTALSPFTIDMYLPAFQSIANEFGTTVAQISLSLSSYFVGVAVGQLVYGPLSDRFGRKRPLYMGLIIYFISALICMKTKTSEMLILWRFVQALGACVAGVTSMAMVRDIFPTKERAKVFSLLVLILGVSPLLAPTIGGYLETTFGWQAVFLVLAMMSGLLLLLIKIKLPESHFGDESVQLKIIPIAKNYWGIFKNPFFYTYALSSAIAFAGLFVYLAGSPIIFMQTFGVNARVYGWIFAIIAAGLVGSSQLNVVLLKRFSNEQLLFSGLMGQVAITFFFLIGVYFSWFDLRLTVAMLFMFLACFGITNPNGSALALAPFSTKAGSASALIGFVQMGAGAIASMCIGVLKINTMLPIVAIMATTSTIGLAILYVGTQKINRPEA